MRGLIIWFLLCLCICNANAQTFYHNSGPDNRSARRERQLREFVSHPYIFAGISGGITFSVPVQQITSVPEYTRKYRFNTDEIIQPRLQAFLGLHWKRNIFTFSFENLQYLHVISVISRENVVAAGWVNNIPVNYFSLGYNFDVFPKIPRFRFQPGLHLGFTTSGGYLQKQFYTVQNQENGVTLFSAGITQSLLQKNVFVFGPDLNLEVNIARWFSISLNQRLAYGVGWIMASDITYQFKDEEQRTGSARTRLLNYGASVSLRFKMYKPGTREIVDRKMDQLF